MSGVEAAGEGDSVSKAEFKRSGIFGAILFPAEREIGEIGFATKHAIPVDSGHESANLFGVHARWRRRRRPVRPCSFLQLVHRNAMLSIH